MPQSNLKFCPHCNERYHRGYPRIKLWGDVRNEDNCLHSVLIWEGCAPCLERECEGDPIKLALFKECRGKLEEALRD